MKQNDGLTQAKQSKETLNLGYIDLLLEHWPDAMPDMTLAGNFPLEKKTWLLSDDVDITKSIEFFNLKNPQLRSLLVVTKTKLVSNEIESTPYLQQKKLISFANQHEIIITDYSLFSGGLRETSKGQWKPSQDRVDLWQKGFINSIAKKYNQSFGKWTNLQEK